MLVRVFKKFRDILTDGSFSQRRDAQNAFTGFLSSRSFLVCHIEVGNQKKDKKSANELEFYLTKKGLNYLYDENFQVLMFCLFLSFIGKNENFFQVRSITHDEHTEVTAYVNKHLGDLFPGARHFHDFWHKLKSLDAKLIFFFFFFLYFCISIMVGWLNDEFCLRFRKFAESLSIEEAEKKEISKALQFLLIECRL